MVQPRQQKRFAPKAGLPEPLEQSFLDIKIPPSVFGGEQRARKDSG